MSWSFLFLFFLLSNVDDNNNNNNNNEDDDENIIVGVFVEVVDVYNSSSPPNLTSKLTSNRVRLGLVVVVDIYLVWT